MVSVGGRLSAKEVDELPGMLAAQTHRGPDAGGVWHSPSLALGHRRLAIFDTASHADQPMVTADGHGVIAFNGAVYNFHELKSELEQEGLTFRTKSDTEVVLAALHHWGPDTAVPRFNGMFALAYFDLRTQTLWLIRDRLGIKPLSVAVLPERIVFASEDKALLACRGVSGTIDTREIILRLALQARAAAASLFSGLERLPPAAIWRIADGRIERRTYWHALDALDMDRMLRPADHAALQQTLLAHFDRSVELHCRADTTLAAACSAGVDSGLITAFARKRRTPFHAYVVDPLVGGSEASDAERTARHLGVSMRRVPLDQQRFLELWPRVVQHLESGGWSNSNMAMLLLTERCRADGVKVLLTGEGADELFGGYRWHAQDAKRWRPLARPYRWLMRPARRRSLERRLAAAPFSNSLGLASELERGIVTCSLAPEQNFLQQKIMRRLEPITSLPERAFVGSGIHDLYTHMQELLYRHDRLSMAHGVELRVPFLENTLIDFALHLPPSARFHRKQGKWLLKRIAAKHLPAENVWARKRGFPIDNAFTTGTQELLRDGLLADVLRWSRGEVADLIGLAAREERIRIWLVGMELFLRIFVGQQSVEDLASALVRMRADADRSG
jgi:asparagine synthase (glutamine-hydrolysing)